MVDLDLLGAIFFDRVENPGFEPLKDQAISTFHLAVAPGVSHGGVVHIDVAFLAEVPEFQSGEGGAQVCDDPIGHSEPVRYLLDELGGLGCCRGRDWLHLDPLGELVDGDEYIGVAALRGFQGSHRIDSPAGEWTGWGDRPQGLSRDVLLL